MRNYNKVKKSTTIADEGAHFIMEQMTETVEQGSKEQPPRTAVVVNCSRLNVRDQPNKYGHAFYVLKAGDTVTVKDIVNGWADIYTDDGVKGYVMEEYIKEG